MIPFRSQYGLEPTTKTLSYSCKTQLTWGGTPSRTPVPQPTPQFGSIVADSINLDLK